MTALSAARAVQSKELGARKWFLAANSKTFYNGAFAMLNSSGLLEPAAASAGNLGCVGIVELDAGAQAAAGTSGYIASGTGGDVKINVREGVFDLVGATLGQDDVGKLVYALDDQTLDETAPAASTGQCPIAGPLVEYLTASTGLVEMTWRRPQTEHPRFIMSGYKLLAEIADGDVFAAFTPGYPCILTALKVMVATAASTASKATTLNVEIGSTDCTGTIALTTANCTEGAQFSQALTGGVYVGPSDTVTIEASSTTAFSEGSINIMLEGKTLSK